MLSFQEFQELVIKQPLRKFKLYKLPGSSSYEIRDKETNKPMLEPNFTEYERYLTFYNKKDAEWFLYDVLTKDLTEEELRLELVKRFPTHTFRMTKEEIKRAEEEEYERMWGKKPIEDK